MRKVHGGIEFNQKAWLKQCFEMNTKLRQKTKINCEEDYFKLMKNEVFGKTMEKVRKHRNVCNNRKQKKMFSIRTKQQKREKLKY